MKLTTLIVSLILSTMSMVISAQSSSDMTNKDLAYKEYTDSIFYNRFNSEQLKDTTTLDKQYLLFHNGMKYAMNSEINKALQNFIACIEIDPKRNNKEVCAAAFFQSYRILQSLRDYERAYYFLTQANLLMPNNITYLENLAWFDFSINNYTQAKRHYKRLDKLSPGTPQYYHILSSIYTETGDYKKALKELDKLVLTEGNSLDIVSERASIYRAMKNFDKAEAEYLDYAQANPSQRYEAMFYLCLFYDKIGDTDKLFSTLQTLKADYPDKGGVYLYLADYYKKQNDDTNHRNTIFSAILTQSVSAEKLTDYIRPIIAETLQQRDTANTLSIITLLNTNYENNPTILSLTADTYQALNDTTKWLNTLYALSDISNDENVDLKIIELEQLANNTDNVIALTSKGYGKYKTDRWAFYHIVSFGGDENRYDTMIATAQHLLPAIENNLIKSSVFQLIGDISYSTRNDSVATIMYDSCLIYNPKNSGALNNLAYNITKQQDPDLNKAEKYATKALEIDPDNTTILDTYAWILFLRHDYMLSRLYFNKLTRIEEDNALRTSPEILYHRGRLSIELEDNEATKQLFTQALELNKIDYLDKNRTISEPNIIDYMIQWLDDQNNK